MRESDHIRAGVGAVVFRGGDVLLIRRGKPPLEGAWSIPGGAIGYGEPVRAALAREVREETGVEIAIVGLIDVYESIRPGAPGAPKGHDLMIDYAARWVSGEPTAGDDALAAEFTPFDEALSRLEWKTTRDALVRARTLIEVEDFRLAEEALRIRDA